MMRRYWLLSLAGCFILSLTFLLGGDQLPTPKTGGGLFSRSAAVKIDPEDEAVLRRAEVALDGDALVKFLRKRILAEKERPEIELLLVRLGSSEYRVRQKAALALIQRGPAAIELLRAARPAPRDLEVLRRIDSVIERIQEKDGPAEVRAVAVRVLSQLNPDGLTEALVGYLPFADHPRVIDEIRFALTRHALRDGKADPHLLAALSDRSALRRATAAEALGRAAYSQQKDAVRKMLNDPDPTVRYRTARGLAFSKDQEAVPVLIDALTELPINAAWQDEDFLLRLAGTTPPPAEPMGNDRDAREKCKAAWHAWWKMHSGKIDLAKLEDDPRVLGRTLVVLLDEKKVLELGADNLPRWEIHDVNYPLDAQLIGDDRVLIAEYYGHRVVERDTGGRIVWQKMVQGPQAAQRLANGNTFVATGSEFFEFDKDGRLVDSVSVSEEAARNVMKSMKLPGGDIVCLTADARIVRYSPTGKELSSFQVVLGQRLYGGRIDVLPSGRVLVPHNAENKVVEYDSRGKIVWEAPFPQPVAATRVSNGNTIITSMDPAIGAVEVDRTGTEVWSYRSTARVTRAIRR